jgi:general secretion pathway protein L
MSELAPLLPSASRAALQRHFARPVIQFADGEAVFWRAEVSNGAARLAATERVALAGDPASVLAAGRAAVARIAASASGGIAAPKVVIALGARQVLRKDLTLPAALEENLTQALAYDLDRHTPFRADQLYFDAAVVGRDTTRKTVRVDWVAALRGIVDSARKEVEDWGAVPVAVVPGMPGATASRLNLLPSGARPRPLAWRRWQVWAPLALMVLLIGAAVFVPLLQKREYAIALGGLNAEAGQQAQVADKLRAELERMQSDYNFILAKKYAYPSVVLVLDEVTKVLPDDTWLTQLELKGAGRGKESQRDLYLRGESVNAGKLIALLEDSKLVEGVTPRSPTTKIQGSSGEIFDLGARLRALPPPSAVALADLPVPVAARAPAPPAAVPPSAAAPTGADNINASGPAAPVAPPVAVPPGSPTSRTAAAGFGPFPNAPAVGAPIPAERGAGRSRGGRPARPAANGVPEAVQPAPAQPPRQPPSAGAVPEAATPPAASDEGADADEPADNGQKPDEE